MKKAFIISLLSSLALCSCGNSYTYGKLISSLANESNNVLFEHSKSPYNYKDYFTYVSNEIIVYVTATKRSSTYVNGKFVDEYHELKLRLPYQNDVPSTYYCEYKIDYETYAETYQRYEFGVSNDITRGFIPYLNNFKYDNNIRDIKQKEAAEFLGIAIAEIGNYVGQKYMITLQEVGMFPNY